MKFISYTIVFKEHPEHISLLFQISNCKNACSGCHSPELQQNIGTELTNEEFSKILDKYRGLITNVMFFGGDSESEALIEKLKITKHVGLTTTLWSGKDKISNNILELLDFIKLGGYDSKLGGLDSKITNQTYFECKTGRKIHIGEPK